MTSKLKFQLQRVSTILRSLKTVYTLPSEQIDAFLDSYNIYDHNWANEDEMKRTMGADYYSVVKRKLVDYYNVLNQLCSVGQIEKMYIPPVMDLSKSVIANQTLFEQKMSRDLGLKRGSNALDIGCGRGRVATEMAAYSGANVQGINIDPGQIAHANRLAIEYGLAKQCQFKIGDINNLPLSFSANAFDAVYHIQVFTYSRDLQALFKDIHRTLKPGARFACLDFVTLPDYDKNNP